MSAHVAMRLAWSLCALSLVMTILSVLLLALNYTHPKTHVYGFWLENTVLPISFSIIGAVIATRLPANPLGRLFCAAACVSAVAHLSVEYAIHALFAQPDTLPAGEALAWLTSWVWVLFVGCTVLSPLLFPDGHLPDSGWKWLAWVTVLLTSAGAVWQAFSPGVIVSLGSFHNPHGIEGLPRANEPLQAIMFSLLFVAVASSLSVRLRRAGG